ncbi:MAG: acyltransferase family protein [Lachnospiraceae bacterium]
MQEGITIVMQTQTRTRNITIDACKGLAIILVMLGHCIVLNGLQDGLLYDAIKAIQMPFFMMISGYLVSASPRSHKIGELGKRICQRAVGYLLPFFSWIILLHPTSIVESTRTILFQLDKGLWFLMVLFLLTLVMYLALYTAEHTKLSLVGFCMIWLLFVGLLLYQTAIGNHFLSPHLTLYQLPFYLGGFLVHEIAVRIQPSFGGSVPFKRGITVVAVSILFLGLIIGYDMIVAHNKIELGLQFLAGFAGCFICYNMIQLLPYGKLKKALAYIGQFTLEIYVLHYHFATVLPFGGRGFKLWSVQGILWVMAAFTLMSIGTAIGLFILKRFRITNLLLFGKHNQIRN